MGADARSPAGQLPLDLPLAPRFGREDFLAAPANEAALGMIERWPDWPDLTLLLIGPHGAGKTHLLSIWAQKAGATWIDAAEPRIDLLDQSPATAFVIDDIDRIVNETALFHLLNVAIERRAYLVMSATRRPRADDVRLPDLLSRLRRAPVVEIGAPDDALMRAVLEKLFGDRQLVVEPPALAYIALRLERSLGAARACVAALDREALAQGRRVTRSLAAQVMERFGTEETG